MKFLFKKLDRFSIISAPLLSLFFLMNGMGLMLTFMPIYLKSLEVSSWNIGLITACYYFGMGVGAFSNAGLILRVGHIRTFAALATLTTCVILLNAIFKESLWCWYLVRGITGFCLAGLYIVIESWILKAGTVETRGRYLALYMIVLFAASASGQLLLNLSTHSEIVPFLVICILVSFSIFPLSVTVVGTPVIEKPDALGLKKLFKLSPTGWITCVVSGLVYASVVGFLPLYIHEQAKNLSDTAFMMFIVLIGAMAMQYPVGKLSDHMDRRKVILALFVIVFVISVLLFSVSHFNQFVFYIIIFLFGGATASIYPLSISHTCDVVPHEQIISAIQGLVLAYCIGSVSGPILTSLFINLIGVGGLFVCFVLIAISLIAYLLIDIIKLPPTSREGHQDYAPVPITTPIASELDPRGE